MTENELRERLAALRDEAGLTQAQLAERIAARTDSECSGEWVSRHEAPPDEDRPAGKGKGKRRRSAAITVSDAQVWAAALGYGLVVELVPPTEGGAAVSGEARQVLAEFAAVAASLDARALRTIRAVLREQTGGE